VPAVQARRAAAQPERSPAPWRSLRLPTHKAQGSMPKAQDLERPVEHSASSSEQ
jgi:hypothetical protein